MTSSSDSSSLYTSTAQSGPPLLMHYYCPILAFKHLIPLPLTSYFLTTASCSWLFLYTSCFLFPPDSLRVLQWNAGGLRVRSTELLRFILSHPVDLICIHESILIHPPLSGFLDFLLCDLIAPTPGREFFLLMSHTLASASSFSSDRVSPSLNFLPPLFLRLTFTLIM